MDVQEYWRVLRQQVWAVVGCTVLVTVLAAGWSLTRTPVYASTTQLMVSSAQNANALEAFQGGALAAQRVASYTVLASGRLMAQQVIDKLDLDATPDDLVGRVEATVIPDTLIIQVKVRDTNAKRAQATAKAYADELVVATRSIDGEVDIPIKATVIDPASFSDDPVAPRTLLNVLVAFLAGLLLGLVAAVLRHLLDTSLRTPEDIARVTDAPIMGTIAAEGTQTRGVTIDELDSHAPRVEAFRVLRTNISFVDIDKPHKVLVVTSSLPEEGKTSTAVNLAISLAKAGVRTLLVDADLRRPSVAGWLGLEQSAGVTTVLVGKVALEDAVQPYGTTGLEVLPSGVTPPNAAELLQTDAMVALLDRLRASYEVVVIDTPPLLPVTDAALLATKADGALLVTRHGRTKQGQVAGSVERLARVDATLVGVVRNMVPGGKLGQSYGGYGYGYGYEPKSEEDWLREATAGVGRRIRDRLSSTPS